MTNATTRKAIETATSALSDCAVRQLYTLIRDESTSADLFTAMNATVDDLASAPGALPTSTLETLARFAVAAALEAGWGKEAADKWLAMSLCLQRAKAAGFLR
jgi:hypothetical protein